MLQPLADAGSIHPTDVTGFFDADADRGCGSLFDSYHQNAEGGARFNRWMRRQIEGMLYPNFLQGTRS